MQDFDFPTAANTLRVSPDGRYVIGCGTYKPQLKVFELDQLAMKLERHMDAEGIAVDYFSDDWKKFAVLRDDRCVEFHAQYGLHHRVRVPKFGRDLRYLRGSADLLVAAAGPQVYRLNTFRGEFQAPIESGMDGGVNALAESPVHGLIALAGADGTVACFDPRDYRRPAARIVLAESLARLDARASGEVAEANGGATAISFGPGALRMGVGTASGHVLLYDIRAPTPLRCRDHRYGLPIRRVSFCEGAGAQGRVVTADKKVIKIWETDAEKLLTAVEPPADVNDMCVYPRSGLIMAACESHRMHIWYVPKLGPAPRWCHYLDGLTEELEESTTQSVYDDYKFVTRAQLEAWGAADLIGTEALRAYMHGFFVDVKLYRKIQSVADPYAYERYHRKRVEEAVEASRAKRVNFKRALPKVNRDLARAILKDRMRKRGVPDGLQEGGDGADAKEKATSSSSSLVDPRFSAMFEDEDYQVDVESETFVRLHPSQAHQRRNMRARAEEDSDGDDSDDALRGRAMEALARGDGRGDESSEDSSDDASEDPADAEMLGVPMGYSARQLIDGKGTAVADPSAALSLEERLKKQKRDRENPASRERGGSTPSSNARARRPAPSERPRFPRKTGRKGGSRKRRR